MDKIICVGKNYVDHVKELGDAIPERPVLFMKPPSVLKSASRAGDTVELRVPPAAGALHHECEIVLRLNCDGYRMSVAQAAAAISDVTLGLDMTLRDRQNGLKKAGHPWEISKAFLDSAVIGNWVALVDFPDFMEASFTFALDGVIKQTGTGQQMGMKPAECVAYASEHFPLKAGDLIFTGTPAGVGPVKVGQGAEMHWGKVHFKVKWTQFE